MDIKSKYYNKIKTNLSPQNHSKLISNNISPKCYTTRNKSFLKILKLKLNNKNKLHYNPTSNSLFPKLSKYNLSPCFKSINDELNNIKKIKNNRNKKKDRESLLTFDPCLKMLNENLDLNPYNKKLIEEREKKIDELYFDYDRRNDNFKFNSFSGNNANLLKCKVLFVKGVLDFIYPRMIIKRMKFVEKKNRKEIKEKIQELNEEFNKNKIFIKKFRTPEEKIKMSKYELNGAYSNEAIKTKGNLIKLKKILINSHTTTKLTKLYDFKE